MLAAHNSQAICALAALRVKMQHATLRNAASTCSSLINGTEP
jgi:hypothetical protein